MNSNIILLNIISNPFFFRSKFGGHIKHLEKNKYVFKNIAIKKGFEHKLIKPQYNFPNFLSIFFLIRIYLIALFLFFSRRKAIIYLRWSLYSIPFIFIFYLITILRSNFKLVLEINSINTLVLNKKLYKFFNFIFKIPTYNILITQDLYKKYKFYFPSANIKYLPNYAIPISGNKITNTEKKLKICFFSSLKISYGIKELIEYLISKEEENPKLEYILDIYGEGELFSDLKDITKSSKNIFIKGGIPSNLVSAKLSQYSLNLVLSHEKVAQSPIKLFDAIDVGVPSLYKKTDEINVYVNKGLKPGLLFKNFKELYEHIENLHNNRLLINKIKLDLLSTRNLVDSSEFKGFIEYLIEN